MSTMNCKANSSNDIGGDFIKLCAFGQHRQQNLCKRLLLPLCKTLPNLKLAQLLLRTKINIHYTALVMPAKASKAKLSCCSHIQALGTYAMNMMVEPASATCTRCTTAHSWRSMLISWIVHHKEFLLILHVAALCIRCLFPQRKVRLIPNGYGNNLRCCCDSLQRSSHACTKGVHSRQQP